MNQSAGSLAGETVLPDWADFPPNRAMFNLFRLGKLSLGGKFTQSGNAVDNKQTRSARIAAQSKRRKAGEII